MQPLCAQVKQLEVQLSNGDVLIGSLKAQAASAGGQVCGVPVLHTACGRLGQTSELSEYLFEEAAQLLQACIQPTAAGNIPPSSAQQAA